jgi:hypothetical protein
MDVDVKAALLLSMLFRSRKNFLSCAFRLGGLHVILVSGLVLIFDSTTYLQWDQLVIAQMEK